MTLVDVRRIGGRDAEETFAGADFAVLPLGSIEWHGPHLPLGTDTLIVEDLVGALSDAPWRGVLYPTVTMTAVPGQTRHYPGTIGIRPDVMVDYFAQLIGQVADAGFSRILLVNAHDANMATVRSAMEWVSGTHTVSMLLANWFQMVTPAETEEIFGTAQSRGHGGAYETSGVLVAAPDLVARDGVDDMPPRPRLSAADHVLVEPHPEPWLGWSGLISHANPEAADRTRRIAHGRFRALIEEWLDTSPPQPPGRRI